MKYISIGNVKILRTAALAPMASVADRAFRIVCKEYGAAYMVSEMISAKGLCYGDKKTEQLCTVTDCERPYALQIFGEEPEFIGRAAGLLQKFKPDIIDINMGCPVPKIAGNGSGSALMKNAELAAECVRMAVKNSAVPITVKIRSGWDSEHINAPEFAAEMERAGASAVTVHARTKMQMYGGKADRSIIKKVRDTVKIPVIGNGDIDSAQSAADMYNETGCELVMIGRGACGKPWIFRDIERYIEKGEIPVEPTVEEKLETMLRQTKLAVGFKGERTAFSEARRQCAFYVKGLPEAAKFRNECGTISSMSDLEKICREISEAAR